MVQVPANVYDGKYYDFRTIDVRVYKGEDGVETPIDAADWVNSHKVEVLAQLDKKRWRVGNTVPRNVNAVAHPVEKNVFFGPGVSYRVRASSVTTIDKAPVVEAKTAAGKRHDEKESKKPEVVGIACPRCKSSKGQRCKASTYPGDYTYSHAERVKAFEKKGKSKKAVKEYVEAPSIKHTNHLPKNVWANPNTPPYELSYNIVGEKTDPRVKNRSQGRFGIHADSNAEAVSKAKRWVIEMGRKRGLTFELTGVYDMFNEAEPGSSVKIWSPVAEGRKASSKKEGTCETKGCFAKATHNRGFGKGKPSNTCDKCFKKLSKKVVEGKGKSDQTMTDAFYKPGKVRENRAQAKHEIQHMQKQIAAWDKELDKKPHRILDINEFKRKIYSLEKKLKSDVDFGGKVVKESREDECGDAIENAIVRRIELQHPEIVNKYGLFKIKDAARERANGIGEVDEIGSSDVSIWVRQTIGMLTEGHGRGSLNGPEIKRNKQKLARVDAKLKTYDAKEKAYIKKNGELLGWSSTVEGGEQCDLYDAKRKLEDIIGHLSA